MTNSTLPSIDLTKNIASYFGFEKHLGIVRCLNKPLSCPRIYGMEFGKWAAYEIPKYALETVSSWPSWGAKTVYDLTSSWAQNLNLVQPETIEEIEKIALTEIYDPLAARAEKLSLLTTHWVTGKSFEKLNEEAAMSLINESGEVVPTFKAIDLLGGTLINAYATRQALINLSETLGNAVKLISGVRIENTDYIIQSKQNTMINGSKTTSNKVKVSSTAKLFGNVALGTVFTGMWGLGTYLSACGIYNAIESASNQKRANLMTPVILIAAQIVPPILGMFVDWAKEKINVPDTKNSKDVFGYSSSDYLNISSTELNKSFNSSFNTIVKKIKDSRSAQS